MMQAKYVKIMAGGCGPILQDSASGQEGSLLSAYEGGQQ
jgi:hypothetical protein